MSINKINPKTIEPQRTEQFGNVLSKREKAYIEKSFPNTQTRVKPKDHIGRYIDIKV